jgi:hypothetical protein
MRLVLLCAGLAAGVVSGAALACADVREVPLTPERVQQYEKQRAEARGNIEKARREKNQVEMDLSRAEMARIDQILGSGREQVVQPPAKAPSRKCAG